MLELRARGLDVVLVLVGLGGASFCALFFRARSVPAALAAWGVATYLAVLGLGAARIVLPALPEAVAVALYANGALFEILFGAWLLVKGVERTRRGHVPA